MSKIATAERVSLEKSDNFVFQRSLLAYHHAAEIIGGDILEIGTGSGYGVEILAPKATRFITIDKQLPANIEQLDNTEYFEMEVPPINFENSTFDNVVSFQDILDRTDYSVEPKDTSPAIREQGDIRYFKVNQILRNEVDNTLEIISILKEDLSTIITVDVKFKSVMNYGSDIIDDLKKKITIMENHRRDFERLYKSYNR